jgi:hypothetical protein
MAANLANLSPPHAQAASSSTYAVYGGAIDALTVGRKLTIRNSVFYKNAVIATGVAATGSATHRFQGGAIYTYGYYGSPVVDIVSSNFTNNRVIAPSALGAVTSAYLVRGGGIAVYNTSLRISSCTVAHNQLQTVGSNEKGMGNATGGGERRSDEEEMCVQMCVVE